VGLGRISWAEKRVFERTDHLIDGSVGRVRTVARANA
jgi:hypothetical protein